MGKRKGEYKERGVVVGRVEKKGEGDREYT